MKPLVWSNFSTARMRPRLPSWMRSRNSSPRPMWRLAMDTTRRRLASMSGLLGLEAVGHQALQRGRLGVGDAVGAVGELQRGDAGHRLQPGLDALGQGHLLGPGQQADLADLLEVGADRIRRSAGAGAVGPTAQGAAVGGPLGGPVVGGPTGARPGSGTLGDAAGGAVGGGSGGEHLVDVLDALVQLDPLGRQAAPDAVDHCPAQLDVPEDRHDLVDGEGAAGSTPHQQVLERFFRTLSGCARCTG